LNKHPDTKRPYLLRSFVFCHLCGKRMSGKTMRRHSYFACEPAKNLGPKARDLYPKHPSSIYVREDALELSVERFFAERVFGSHREEFLRSQLHEEDPQELSKRRAHIRSLRKQLKKTEELLNRQVRLLETEEDLSPALVRRVSDRVAELEEERIQMVTELKSLEESSETERDSSYLIESLPILDGDFELASQQSAREMLEAFRLKMSYDKLIDKVLIQVTVDAREVDSILGLITHLGRAPNGIRTRVSTLKGWRPRPLVDGGC
jgi:site-specific DNA recombinase